MNKISLLEFIATAHRNTYAGSDEVRLRNKSRVPILDGHIDYDFVKGDWRYHDSYAGVQWAPGREVVFFKGKPVWCMSYQGQTVDGLATEFVEETFEFLKKALMNMNVSMPFRGPSKFSDGEFEYRFEMKGDYKYFTGRESIRYKKKEIFFQDVMGTLIK